MKVFTRISMFLVLTLVLATCVCFAQQTTGALASYTIEGAVLVNADAENGDTYGMAGTYADLLIVDDPIKPGNQVYYLDAGENAGQFVRMSCTASFKPGSEYLIEFDVLAGTDAFGNTIQQSIITSGFNFVVSGAYQPYNVNQSYLYPNKWTHVKCTYKVPESVVSGGFFVYVNPVATPAGNAEVSFYLDNINVVPVTTDDEEPEEPQDPEDPDLEGGNILVNVDAENGKTYGMIATAADLKIVDDPLIEGNKVYWFNSNDATQTRFNYMRYYDGSFEPGRTYFIEYDILLGNDVLGNPVEQTTVHTVFNYWGANETRLTDHGTGQANVYPNAWTHINQTFTVPKDIKQFGNFGIYTQPRALEGVGFSPSVDFYLDNLTVVPIENAPAADYGIEGLNKGDVIHFEGSTTKNAIEYKAGETMTFKLCIKKGSTTINAPLVWYSCVGDDGNKTSGYVKQSDDGYYYFDTKCERDGFVRVIAKLCDAKGRILTEFSIFEGGAGAEIKKVTIDTVEPDDYLEFWEELKEVAFSLENEVIYDSGNISKDPNFIEKDVRLKTAEGAGDFATFVYSYPKNAEPGSLKLKFIYQGYSVAGIDTAPYNPDTITVYVCAHDIPNRQTYEYYNALAQLPKYKEYGMSVEENTNPETSYWWKMYVRDMQVFNYFRNHELFNGKDISFTGISQGGFQACNMAAHSGYATYCYMEVPWFGNIFGPQLGDRMSGWSPTPVDGLRYFDTAVAAKYVKCKTDIVAGLGDYTCPPSTIMAMYNNMTCEKQLTFDQNRTHLYIQPANTSSYVTSEIYVEFDAATKTATIKSPEAYSDVCVYAATYENKVLSGLVPVVVDLSEGTTTVTFDDLDLTNADSVKIMIMENADDIKPICRMREVDLK